MHGIDVTHTLEYNPERLPDNVDFSLPAQPHPIIVMYTLDPFVVDEDTDDATLGLGRYREICWIVRQYRQTRI